jgi:hypothetical protein
MNNWVKEGRVQEGLTYAEYAARWRESLTTSLGGLEKDARKRLYYSRYNIDRLDRLRDVYTPSESLRQIGEKIEEPQIWMVLSEDWCGDSAFALPIIAAAADATDAELRILHRDEHPDIMDAYVTNGARSIPKLVAFDMNGNELFTWGPRPQSLLDARKLWEAEGKTKPEMSAAGVEWYEAGNWADIESELIALLEAHVGVPIS